jgi:hypothetical protein
MFSRWLRSGIRTQITIMVLIGAVLTTAVTLLIADASIQGYALQQANAQQRSNLNVALLVLNKQFHSSVSIDPQSQMVIDSPTLDTQNFTTDPSYKDFGRLPLNAHTEYVDQVQNAVPDTQVSVYQCVDTQYQPFKAKDQRYCPRISTTLTYTNAQGAIQRETDTQGRAQALTPNIFQGLGLKISGTGIVATALTDKTLQETIDGNQYLSTYHLISDPQGQVIGVLSVSEPLANLNALINRTTLELIISGVVIMLGGIILALLVASTISGTLMRASRQLGAASSQLTTISDAQSGGAKQQVWAINAINQALQNLQETSSDVSRRTDQLAQLGLQVSQRRAELAPPQFESVMQYMTRSANDISVASRHQATTIERMTSAMAAVVEIADQVSGSSQQTTESAKRLDSVISELEQLVTGRARSMRRTMNEADMMAPGPMHDGMTSGTPSTPPRMAGQRPMGQPDRMGPPNGVMNGGRGASAPNAGYNVNGRPMLPGVDRSPPSRPRMNEPEGWSRTMDDRSSSGNYPYGAGGNTSRPNMDQGRNAR